MRKLGELNVVGTVTRILHATQEEAKPYLAGHGEGEHTQGGGSLIYLRRYEGEPASASSLFATLAHEFLHAAFYSTSARLVLRNALPNLTQKARDAIEEDLVSALAPALVTAFPGLVATNASIKKVARTK